MAGLRQPGGYLQENGLHIRRYEGQRNRRYRNGTNADEVRRGLSSGAQMHQFNADTYPTIMEAMWSQAAIVWYYARHNDNAQADAAYTKMLSVFKEQKTLPKEVFQIGDIYTDSYNILLLDNFLCRGYKKTAFLYKLVNG
jgi:hypothetical protein